MAVEALRMQVVLTGHQIHWVLLRLLDCCLVAWVVVYQPCSEAHPVWACDRQVSHDCVTERRSKQWGWVTACGWASRLAM